VATGSTNGSIDPARATTDTVQADFLWLPTEREMFGESTASASNAETASNQAHFEYYSIGDAGNSLRIKRNNQGAVTPYWEASPSGNIHEFNAVYASGAAGSNNANTTYGLAPAFCIK
jgi:hypothetical protein